VDCASSNDVACEDRPSVSGYEICVRLSQGEVSGPWEGRRVREASDGNGEFAQGGSGTNRLVAPEFRRKSGKRSNSGRIFDGFRVP
jgi:hypothetical protein